MQTQISENTERRSYIIAVALTASTYTSFAIQSLPPYVQGWTRTRRSCAQYTQNM